MTATNQILGKSFQRCITLLWSVVWVHLRGSGCVCVCRVMFVRTGEPETDSSHHPGGLRWSCIQFFISSPLSMRLCSTWSLPEMLTLKQSHTLHLARSTPLFYPPSSVLRGGGQRTEDGGLGCSPVPVSLMLDTRLQSPQHQSWGLGTEPSSYPSSSLTHTHTHTHTHTRDKSCLPLRFSSRFNKRIFPTGEDTTRPS